MCPQTVRILGTFTSSSNSVPQTGQSILLFHVGKATLKRVYLMFKAGNKEVVKPQPYKVSFSTGNSRPCPVPQAPKSTVITAIAAINERQDSLFKRPKVVKLDIPQIPSSLEVSLKRPAEPIVAVNTKRAKFPQEPSSLIKPINEDIGISSLSEDIDTYLSLEGERIAIGELRRALGEGGCGEEEMVRLVNEARATVRKAGLRVAEETLSLLQLFSLKSEWSLLMTLSCLPTNPT